MPTYVALRSFNSSNSVRVPAVGAVAAPGTITPTGSNSGGSLATATYYYKVTAVGAFGETTPATEVNSGARTGPSASCALAWAAVPNASSYRIYIGTSSNGQTGYFTSTTNSFSHTTQTGLVTATVPTTNTATYRIGQVELTETADTLVNVDDIPTRVALNQHKAIGQFIVSAANNKTAAGVTLPVNS